MKLIDKDKVVAEIEKRLDKLYNLLPDSSKVENGITTTQESCNTGKYMALESFRKFLNTLEVKEVDLEEEIKKIYLKHRQYGGNKNILVILNELQFNDIAKHFFELGLKAKEK